jgi:hypothetical protein
MVEILPTGEFRGEKCCSTGTRNSSSFKFVSEPRVALRLPRLVPRPYSVIMRANQGSMTVEKTGGHSWSGTPVTEREREKRDQKIIDIFRLLGLLFLTIFDIFIRQHSTQKKHQRNERKGATSPRGGELCLHFLLILLLLTVGQRTCLNFCPTCKFPSLSLYVDTVSKVEGVAAFSSSP